jgi:hypothetical protein
MYVFQVSALGTARRPLKAAACLLPPRSSLTWGGRARGVALARVEHEHAPTRSTRCAAGGAGDDAPGTSDANEDTGEGPSNQDRGAFESGVRVRVAQPHPHQTEELRHAGMNPACDAVTCVLISQTRSLRWSALI